MGTTKSKPLPPPPKKRRKKQARIYDYFPAATRLRPNSSQMYRSIEMLTSTGRAPASARSEKSFEDEYEEKRSRVFVKEPMPKWQSKWEIDMRPDPSKQNQQLRSWLSMPLPTLKDPPLHPETVTSDNLANRKDRIRNARRNKRAISPFSENDEKENEVYERTSVKSTRVDGFRMLHKTTERSDNFCIQTARMWNLGERRTSKFLSQDGNLKDIQMQEVVPVLRQQKQSIASKRLISVIPANSE